VADAKVPASQPEQPITASPQRTATHTPAGGTRLAVLLSLLAVALGLLGFGPISDFVALDSDGAVYLLMADYYSPYQPASVLADYVQRVSQFPPLFPLLVALAGGGSGHIAIAHLVQTLSLLAALALIARLAWKLSGSAMIATAAFLCVALLPKTLLLHGGIWSEFTFMAFAYGGLLLAPERDAPLARHWLGALLCACAAATRNAGVVLSAAYALTLLLRAPRRAWPALLLLPVPLVVQSLIYSGGGSAYASLFTERTNGAAALWQHLLANSAAMWDAWLSQFAVRPNLLTTLPTLAVLALAVAGAWQRARTLAMDAWYVAGYLALLLIWPFPEVMPRLLYPLTPLILIYAVLGAQAIARGMLAMATPWPALAPLLLVAGVALPGTAMLVQRYAQAPASFAPWRASREWLQAPDLAAARTEVNFKRTLITLMRQSTALVPPERCIYTVQPGPAMYFTRRVSFPAPTGAARPAVPGCGYQLLLGDTSLEAARRGLWQPNELVLSVSDAGEPAGLLVRYPDVR
jgi:hypothetical protein